MNNKKLKEFKSILNTSQMKKIVGGLQEGGDGACQEKGKECGTSLKCCKGLTCPADGEGTFYCA